MSSVERVDEILRLIEEALGEADGQPARGDAGDGAPDRDGAVDPLADHALSTV